MRFDKSLDLKTCPFFTMLPYNDLLLFFLAALGLVLTPGPNMLYLISRSLSQGKKAGMLSLTGILAGFLVHIVLVSFGLTAVFVAIPMAYQLIKWMGVGYLVYLAWQGIKPDSSSLFEPKNLSQDSPLKLIQMGFLTNVFNPKVAIFYMSFFPQFTSPKYGSLVIQNIQLGFMQLMISGFVNFIILIFAARMASWFQNRPAYIRIQKRFMSAVLIGLAFKMAVDKGK